MLPYRSSQRAKLPPQVCARLSMTTDAAIFYVPLLAVTGACVAIGAWGGVGALLGGAMVGLALVVGYFALGHAARASIDLEERTLFIERSHWSTLRSVEEVRFADLTAVCVETGAVETDPARGIARACASPRICVTCVGGRSVQVSLDDASRRESASEFTAAMLAGLRRAGMELR